MSGPRGVRAAAWLVERVSPRSYGRALAGDLIEARAGRRPAWFWRQVWRALGVAVYGRLRMWALPLLFSAVWSMLYPAWRASLWSVRLTAAMFERSARVDWPYSASLRLGGGLLPAVTFVWLGFLVYLGLRAERVDRRLAWRIPASLSLSLSVLLVAMMGLFSWPGYAGEHTTPAAESMLPGPATRPFSVPLGLSLFVAILSMPAEQERPGATPFVA